MAFVGVNYKAIDRFFVSFDLPNQNCRFNRIYFIWLRCAPMYGSSQAICDERSDLNSFTSVWGVVFYFILVHFCFFFNPHFLQYICKIVAFKVPLFVSNVCKCSLLFQVYISVIILVQDSFLALSSKEIVFIV